MRSNYDFFIINWKRTIFFYCDSFTELYTELSLFINSACDLDSWRLQLRKKFLSWKKSQIFIENSNWSMFSDFISTLLYIMVLYMLYAVGSCVFLASYCVLKSDSFFSWKYASWFLTGIVVINGANVTQTSYTSHCQKQISFTINTCQLLARWFKLAWKLSRATSLLFNVWLLGWTLNKHSC